MSYSVVDLVVGRFPGLIPQRAMLALLASFADESGGNIHPAVTTLALTLRCDERHARRLMRWLDEVTTERPSPWIQRANNSQSDGRGLMRCYKINVRLLMTFPDLRTKEGRDAAKGDQMSPFRPT